jgi:AcrR family transcriptional regulator
VLGKTTVDWKHERREEARRRILDAAWVLAERDGIGGLSLRGVARQVGLRPASLYSYFESKHAIYDAMFAQAYEEFATQGRQWTRQIRSRREVIAVGFRGMLTFVQQSQARYQLMFQRPIPDFQPSPAAYKHSEDAWQEMTGSMTAHGLDDPTLQGLVVCLGAGIAAQQMSNDPGGSHWVDLIDPATDMVLAYIQQLDTAREETT